MNVQEAKIEMVDFCQLIYKPSDFEGKKVRTTTIYAYGGEDFSALYCPQCIKTGTLQPIFTSLYDTQTKIKVAEKLSREKHSSGTVKVVMVGTLSGRGFYIDAVENATYLFKEFQFPEKLSPKALKKVTCC